MLTRLRGMVQRAVAVSPALVQGGSRRYPSRPHVGIGVVVLRKIRQEAEVLLVKRAREPGRGTWAFPGGGLKLGETIADCAAREVYEETGLQLKHSTVGVDNTDASLSRVLESPQPFTAVDNVTKDEQGRIVFHYCIVEVVATPVDPLAEPVSGDDADDVRWLAVKQLPNLHGLARGCARIAAEAVKHFDL